jgi:hypothetical protein
MACRNGRKSPLALQKKAKVQTAAGAGGTISSLPYPPALITARAAFAAVPSEKAGAG